MPRTKSMIGACDGAAAAPQSLLAANDGTVSATSGDWNFRFQFSNFNLYSNQKLAQFRLYPPATQFQVRRKRRSQQRASREYVNCVRCGKTNSVYGMRMDGAPIPTLYGEGWCIGAC